MPTRRAFLSTLVAAPALVAFASGVGVAQRQPPPGKPTPLPRQPTPPGKPTLPPTATATLVATPTSGTYGYGLYGGGLYGSPA